MWSSPYAPAILPMKDAEVVVAAANYRSSTTRLANARAGRLLVELEPLHVATVMVVDAVGRPQPRALVSGARTTHFMGRDSSPQVRALGTCDERGAFRCPAYSPVVLMASTSSPATSPLTLLEMSDGGTYSLVVEAAPRLTIRQNGRPSQTQGYLVSIADMPVVLPFVSSPEGVTTPALATGCYEVFFGKPTIPPLLSKVPPPIVNLAPGSEATVDTKVADCCWMLVDATTGAPIPEFYVSFHVAGSHPVGLGHRFVSDRDGAYRMDMSTHAELMGRRGQRIDVWFSAPKYAPATEPLDLSKSMSTVALRPTAEYRVRFTDATGQPFGRPLVVLDARVDERWGRDHAAFHGVPRIDGQPLWLTSGVEMRVWSTLHGAAPMASFRVPEQIAGTTFAVPLQELGSIRIVGAACSDDLVCCESRSFDELVGFTERGDTVFSGLVPGRYRVGPRSMMRASTGLAVLAVESGRTTTAAVDPLWLRSADFRGRVVVDGLAPQDLFIAPSWNERGKNIDLENMAPLATDGSFSLTCRGLMPEFLAVGRPVQGGLLSFVFLASASPYGAAAGKVLTIDCGKTRSRQYATVLLPDSAGNCALRRYTDAQGMLHLGAIPAAVRTVAIRCAQDSCVLTIGDGDTDANGIRRVSAIWKE